MSIKKLLEDLAPRAVLEFNADITYQKYGEQIFNVARRDPSNEVVDLINTPLNEMNKEHFIRGVIGLLADADPTAHKEYTQFLVKSYSKPVHPFWRIEDVFAFIKPALAKFNSLKIHQQLKADHKDIMKYKSFDQFQQYMQTYPDPVEDAVVDRGQYSEMYSDDKVRIIRPEDTTAAIYFGQGTQWCTAATKGTNYFNRYNRDGYMYILIPKKATHNGEKYQVHFASSQFMDERDSPNDVNFLLRTRFGNLMPFFLKEEPWIGDWVSVADDALIQSILDGIAALTMDKLDDCLNKWRTHDKTWIDHLIKLGYATKERNTADSREWIDWDKVDDDGLNWYEWNDLASDYYQKIIEFINVTPKDLRVMSATRQVENDWDAPDTLSEIPDILGDQLMDYSWGADNTNGIKDYYNITGWLGYLVRVTRQNPSKTWEVKLLEADPDPYEP
jgi:hypothetical protein